MSKRSDAQQRRELLRLTLLLELYKRRSGETPLEYIHTRIRSFMSEAVEPEEIDAELQFVIDRGYVVMRFHDLGATKLFRLHADGVLTVEREHGAHLD